MANIHASGSHLLHLINEILDLSRIEAGKYELHEQAMSICDTLDDCHRLMRLRAENKGLELVEDFDPNLKTIWADERAIRQICLNLLTNAIKFTPRGGSVTMTARSEPDGGQTIIITDTGPGIPKEEIPKVLSAFGQGSLAQKSAEGGTGLGLPIVSRLIELHGGRFELKSELRRGTQAIVRIPATRVLQPMGQIPEPVRASARHTAKQGASARQPATCQSRSGAARARSAPVAAQSPARRASQAAAGRRPPRAFAPVRQKHGIDATEAP
jgi:two-component system cell cycle sensor histidine kinase PleC